MTPALQLLDNFIFAGVPSNAVYDLLKTGWEKANERSWEDLYLDAFEAALEDERPRLAKYSDGEVTLTREDLRKVLRYDLGAAVPSMALSELTDEAFSETLAEALAEGQTLTIGGHTLTEDDYAQLVRRLVQYATVLFKATASQEAFQQAMIGQTLHDHALLEQTQTYLQVCFDLVLAKLDAHTMLLEQIAADTTAIKESLGLDRPTAEIQVEIQTSIDSRRPDLFKAGGLCAGRPLKPALDQFFVAQEFSADRDDLLTALASAFEASNLMPYRADQDIQPGHILCKIAAKIQTTQFGIFELTRSQNRNVYLELGIAVGLNRPFVLIKEADADVSPLAQGLNYYAVRSYAGLRRELGEKLEEYLLDITRYRATELPTSGSSDTYILAHGDHDMPPDFCLAVASALLERNLTPVLIGQDNDDVVEVLEAAGIVCQTVEGGGKTQLDATVAAIQSAQFGLFRVDPRCSADCFLALGIAMGLNRPWRLMSRMGSELPSDILGLSSHEFRSFVDLEERFA